MLTPRQFSQHSRSYVVDDNGLQRDLLAYILTRRESHKVYLADDGAHAVRRIKAGEQFDLILVGEMILPIYTPAGSDTYYLKHFSFII